jgi:hypothetical protein
MRDNSRYASLVITSVYLQLDNLTLARQMSKAFSTR